MSGITTTLKPLLEAVLPKQHVQGLQWHHEWLGALPALASYARFLATRAHPAVAVRVPGIATDVHLRPWTTDRIVFWQVFNDHEYDIDLGRPATIVDAGANIGLTALLFANRYPEARILCIEPDPANFALLAQNIAPYDRVTAMQAGLWSHRAYLRIDNPDADPWGFRVTEADGPTDLPAIGVAEALDTLGVDYLDVLKVDIEGAELEVLSRSEGWIDRIGTLIVETHDWVRPGCSAALAAVAEAGGFRTARSGENVILTRF